MTTQALWTWLIIVCTAGLVSVQIAKYYVIKCIRLEREVKKLRHQLESPDLNILDTNTMSPTSMTRGKEIIRTILPVPSGIIENNLMNNGTKIIVSTMIKTIKAINPFPKAIRIIATKIGMSITTMDKE